MNRELDFTEYGHSLTQSIFADNILLVLVRYQRRRRVGREDKPVLLEARGFLSRIIEAERIFDNPSPSQSSMANARLFDEAVNSISIPLTSKTDFVNYIQKIESTVEKMLSGSKPSQEEISSFEEFFTNYGALQHQRSNVELEIAAV